MNRKETLDAIAELERGIDSRSPSYCERTRAIAALRALADKEDGYFTVEYEEVYKISGTTRVKAACFSEAAEQVRKRSSPADWREDCEFAGIAIIAVTGPDGDTASYGEMV